MDERELLTVGIIEDDPVLQELLAIMLEAEGYRAQIYPAAPVVMSAILDAPPHLLIVDLWMPGLDGVELVQGLGAHAATKHIPIIVFTANPYELKERLPDFQRRGVQLVPKPEISRIAPLIAHALGAPREGK